MYALATQPQTRPRALEQTEGHISGITESIERHNRIIAQLEASARTGAGSIETARALLVSAQKRMRFTWVNANASSAGLPSSRN